MLQTTQQTIQTELNLSHFEPLGPMFDQELGCETQMYEMSKQELIEQNQLLLWKVSNLTRPESAQSITKEVPHEADVSKVWNIITSLVTLIFSSVWLAVKLSFSITVGTIWFFVGPIIGYFWRSFIAGIFKYGIAMSLFFIFIVWALR